MIALLAAFALATGVPAAAAPSEPPAAAQDVPGRSLTLPRPQILGVPVGQEFTDLIAVLTPILRQYPGVSRAFLVNVDYGGEDGRHLAIILEGENDLELSQAIGNAFASTPGEAEALDVIFRSTSEIDDVEAKARPIYQRSI